MSAITLSQAMVGPKLDSTRSTSRAMPSRLVTAASSTARPCSASTPVTRLKRPWRSGATTVMPVALARRARAARRAAARRARRWGSRRAPPPPCRRRARGPRGPTRSRTRSAFHRPQAAGPGGEAVGLGEAGEQPEREQVAHGLGHGLDGGRVVEVAPGGDVGEQEVVADHRLEHGHVGGREPHPRARSWRAARCRPRCDRRDSPCRCRAAARRARAGRGDPCERPAPAALAQASMR